MPTTDGVAPSVGRKLSELKKYDDNDPDELLKHRFLCRGGVLGIYGSTGIGKSSLSMQMKVLWALGRPAFGIIPVKPLKSLLIQAENDDGDIAAMRDGMIDGIGLTPEEAQQAGDNIIVVHEDSCCGDEFFKLVEGELAHNKPDLLIIDPALSYLGGDTMSQKEVGGFLRNKLKPLLNKYKCGCVIIHHTNKTTGGNDTAYAGSGSAEWGNMPRAILALGQNGRKNSYELIAVKRAAKLRWKMADGITPTNRKILKHSEEDDRVFWLEADDDNEVEDAADTTEQCEADILARVPESGTIAKNDLVEKVNKETGTGINKVPKLIKEMVRDGKLLETKSKRLDSRPEIHISRQPSSQVSQPVADGVTHGVANAHS